ncbi:hypothetical protein [Pseudoalteromonas sp. Xi13]|uniref:hypothetical protein n=1 Tax=Pseudoalteromonas sp. Xi13 TaxID=2490635 RepID=UPI000F759895|nr:hypothetical protein [Pseudoalteromonas sp. Xi13]AZN32564.1 hypothetical protein EJ103_07455 [Pseudoalteromonas sp. Xi13]
MSRFSNYTLESHDVERLELAIDLSSIVEGAVEDGDDIREILRDVSDDNQMEFAVDFIESHVDDQALYLMFNERTQSHVARRFATTLSNCITDDEDESELVRQANRKARIDGLSLGLETITEELATIRDSQGSTHAERLKAHDKLKAIQSAIAVLESL